jgi:nucleotide-binding universal stress UspA family protein
MVNGCDRAMLRLTSTTGEPRMFTSIIWATDGSEHADRALEQVKRIADPEHANVHVVHIVEKLVAGRVAGQNVHLDEEEIDAHVEQRAAELRDGGLTCTVQFVPGNTGHVAERIADFATNTGAELIAVGTRGRSAFGGLVLGSVTQRLLHLAPCPVLAVPPVRKAPTLPESEILVPTP